MGFTCAYFTLFELDHVPMSKPVQTFAVASIGNEARKAEVRSLLLLSLASCAQIYPTEMAQITSETDRNVNWPSLPEPHVCTLRMNYRNVMAYTPCSDDTKRLV